MKASDLWIWPESLQRFSPYFPTNVAPWEWVRAIAVALRTLTSDEEMQTEWPAQVYRQGLVCVHKTALLPPYAVIEGPCYIGPECQIRPGAYIRGNVIAGRGCVLGNSCEYKNCLLLDKVETAHFNYVGDSVLGNRCHLGAGVICANLKLARDEVWVTLANGQRVGTGLRKLGVLAGDGAEVGCNSVLQPGCILGRQSAILSMPFSGYLPEGKLARVKWPVEYLKNPLQG